MLFCPSAVLSHTAETGRPETARTETDRGWRPDGSTAKSLRGETLLEEELTEINASRLLQKVHTSLLRSLLDSTLLGEEMRKTLRLGCDPAARQFGRLNVRPPLVLVMVQQGAAAAAARPVSTTWADFGQTLLLKAPQYNGSLGWSKRCKIAEEDYEPMGLVVRCRRPGPVGRSSNLYTDLHLDPSSAIWKADFVRDAPRELEPLLFDVSMAAPGLLSLPKLCEAWEKQRRATAKLPACKSKMPNLNADVLKSLDMDPAHLPFWELVEASAIGCELSPLRATEMTEKEP